MIDLEAVKPITAVVPVSRFAMATRIHAVVILSAERRSDKSHQSERYLQDSNSSSVVHTTPEVGSPCSSTLVTNFPPFAQLLPRLPDQSVSQVEVQ